MSRGLVVVVLLGASACGAASLHADTPPSGGARAWAAAVSGNDPKAAYALLTASVRKQKPYEVFLREWQESELERKQQTTDLQAALHEGIQHGERGRLVLGDGKSTQ